MFTVPRIGGKYVENWVDTYKLAEKKLRPEQIHYLNTLTALSKIDQK